MAKTTIDGVRYSADLAERYPGETGPRGVNVYVDGVWAGKGYWDAGAQQIRDVAIEAPEEAWADLDAELAEEIAEERKAAVRRVTDDQIRTLRREAAEADDLVMAAICDVALNGPVDLDEYTGINSVMDRSRIRCMTQDEAIEECANVIMDASAQA